MAGELAIEVQPREAKGKNANRRLRALGKVPAVVYGMKSDAVPIQVDRKEIMTLLSQGSGENTVFLLKLAGGKEQRHTMIREMQVDSIDRHILHIDFQRIDLAEKVKVRIPVEIIGVSEGVKNEGAMLDFINREVEVECLPGQIPDHLELDVTELHVGDHAEAGQISLPEGVDLLDEPERVILTIIIPRAAAEEEEEEEEEELLLEPGQEEPEVIGRGKEEDGDAKDESD